MAPRLTPKKPLPVQQQPQGSVTPDKYTVPTRALFRGADTVLETLNVPQPAKLSNLPRRIEPKELPAEIPPALAGLPELMAEVAMVSTLEAAFALFQARGGNRVYIPSSAGDDHWLVKTVGRAAADLIIAHFVAGTTGIEIELPRGPTGARADTWRRMHAMIADGASSSEITRVLGISRDTVKYHRAKLRLADDGPQLSLLTFIAEQDAKGDAPALPEPAKKLGER